ncbi:hypothetical protein D3P07_05385 [Paenibacillus sp. 1011MAR3C5]|uniref:hypothetical protein n=1 Tax=Paenibacillus sp. 1011MAR3C5 TaxID=1675787 RepID=UPI000E6C83F2|nr:hypothetical protein [Paenibacillus sp. 1011MAR3C5]RJE89672.1 hypothetical protein D3P07_05385 [Paenibacillus sp. 1011MAR3C5]
MRDNHPIDVKVMSHDSVIGHPVSTCIYIHSYIASDIAVFDAKSTYGFNPYNNLKIVSLEHTLIHLLKESNYHSHLLFPFLHRWKDEINYGVIINAITNMEQRVLLSYLSLVEFNGSKLNRLKKLVSAGEPRSYPEYIDRYGIRDVVASQAHYKSVLPKLELLYEEFQIDLLITAADMKKSLERKGIVDSLDDYRDLLRSIIHFIQEISYVLERLNVSYAYGGSISLFIQEGFEASYDIDLVLFTEQQSDSIEQEVYLHLQNKLQLTPVIKTKGYMGFYGPNYLTIDIEVNQHYKQPLLKKDARIVYKAISEQLIVPLIACDQIFELKTKYLRLKDLNNLFSFSNFTAKGDQYAKAILSKFK